MKLTCFISFLLLSYPLSASTDFQVLSGRKNVQFTANSIEKSEKFEKNGNGSALILSAHWNPDENLPFAIGLSTSRESLYFQGINKSDVLYGHNIQLEIYNWLNFQNYAVYSRISHIVSSRFQRIRTLSPPIKDRLELLWEESGSGLSLGFAFGIAPSVSALAEWQQSIGSKLRSKSSDQTYSMNSQTLKIGMEIGL